jgi:cellulose synthase/poly-beta-1,6-N-acetylglucosamine synthase-like glycosyltransferase
MDSFWIVLQVLIGYNLILPIILYLIYFIKANLSVIEKIEYQKDHEKYSNYDYAIIVTAYEETGLLPPLIESILKLNYDNYLVYIVADKCDVSTLKFDNKKVVLLQPPSILASNIKSHFYAIDNFKRKHEILTIIDSDNLVDANYLNELNRYFDQGFKAVQGTRRAKKTNSTIAQLDAIRDVYYHFYDGKLLFELGSSSTLSGSGMAFKTDFYIDCLSNIEIDGAGFDKVLQARIVKKNEKIAFASDAIVFDEKTNYSQQLVKQRSRWINTWFKYYSFGFNLIGLGFKNRSINQFLFGLILLRPPIFIFIVLSVCCAIAAIALQSVFLFFWLFAFTVFFLGFYIALKNSKESNVAYSSLLSIPKFVFFQFLSLIFITSANKRSVATKHQVDL